MIYKIIVWCSLYTRYYLFGARKCFTETYKQFLWRRDNNNYSVGIASSICRIKYQFDSINKFSSISLTYKTGIPHNTFVYFCHISHKHENNKIINEIKFVRHSFLDICTNTEQENRFVYANSMEYLAGVRC